MSRWSPHDSKKNQATTSSPTAPVLWSSLADRSTMWSRELVRWRARMSAPANRSNRRIFAVSRATTNELPPVDERDHVLGAERPVVTLVEYGDLGCSYRFAAK